MTDFIESLEKKAERITRKIDDQDWDNSIPSVLRRNIALTVHQIKNLRHLHSRQRDKLDRNKCDIDTEILQLEERIPRYSPYKYPEREKFHRQLLGVKSEIRRQDAVYEDRLQNLHKSLLGLIHQYEQVSNINNGHRQDSAKIGTLNARSGSPLA